MAPMKSILAAIAPKEQTPEEKRREMLEQPIGPLIRSLATPAIFANVVTTLYNLADAFFVGQMGSTSASAAVGVAILTNTVIQSVAFYIAQGTGIHMSRCLGAGNRDEAAVYVNTGIAAAIVVETVIAIVGHLALDQLCYLGGATPTILPYARTYIGILLMGAPFIACGFVMNMQLRFQGEAFYSMLCMVAGAVLNTVLTPALIFGANLGIAGSALATVVSEAMSFVLLVAVMRRAGITPLGPRYVRLPNLEMLRTINNGGVPSFMRQVMFGVSSSLLNNAAAPYGDAAIAGIAMVQRITGVANFVQIGIGQGLQPIAGYNLGAGRADRIREGYLYTIRASFVCVAAIGAIDFAFAPQLIGLFRDDPEVIAFGTVMLRACAVTMPFTGLAMATNFLLQTSGKMWRATFIGACRLGLVLAPVAVVLPAALGMLGVQLAQPAADALTTLISLPFARGIMRELDAAIRDSG